mgnify:CR=1 FL=1
MLGMRKALAAATAMVVVATGLVASTPLARAATASGTLTLAAGQAVTAKFTGTKLDTKRQVVLQSSTDGVKWQSVKTVRMSSKGVASFGLVAADGKFYQAVAKAFSYTVKKKKVTAAAVTTPVQTLGAPSFREEFSGPGLDPRVWKQRTVVGYNATGRWCSAPVAANTVVSGGLAQLRTTAVTDAKAKRTVLDQTAARLQKLHQRERDKALAAKSAARAKLTAAKALPAKTKAQKSKRAAAVKKATTAYNKTVSALKAVEAKLTPCPNGVYDNAMISTEGTYSVSAGTVVARVKFAPGQGSHAGLWLQAPGGDEIDIIEAYGHGRGVTNVIHRRVGSTLRKEPAVDKDAYVAAKTVASSSWWSKWHTVAVTFDSGKISFYLDGVRTRQLKGMAGDFALIVSQLSSDWETYRISGPDSRPGSGVDVADVAEPTLPFSMEVDWVRAWEKA